ncbi:hypothetical protein [Nonomuraea sp. SYSU D8015]|uniref:hypothetical protein n=1 Tax=Nonomuraea sp. SYSU D8015 TaxID=2593644 RepID=UPI00166164C7|nr:hypothetical protein [Nonomuraea sp. SYSU D8015]
MDVHVRAIEECGRQATRVRNMLDFNDAFVDGKATAPSGATDAGIFGKLEGAGDLATKIDEVWNSVKHELGEGRNRLKNVDTALGEVVTNYRGAEGASGA